MSGSNEHAHHIVSPRVYVVILIALLIGTALTVWASFIDLGPWNPVIALAIATTKAMLVVLFFMHVWYSTRLTKMIVMSSVFWLLLLLFLTMADFGTRGWMGVPGR